MLVIDAAVSNLDDLPSLEDFLLNLGRKHQAVGVNTQSFAVGHTSNSLSAEQMCVFFSVAREHICMSSPCVCFVL